MPPDSRHIRSITRFMPGRSPNFVPKSIAHLMSDRWRVYCPVDRAFDVRSNEFRVKSIAHLAKCQIDRISCQIDGAFSNVRSIACSMSHRPRVQCRIDHGVSCQIGHGVFLPALRTPRGSPSGLTFSESDVCCCLFD